MLSENTTGLVEVLPGQPRWARIESVIHYTGFSRTLIYRLLAEGSIPSSYIQTEKGKRGFRVVDLRRVDAFIESRETVGMNTKNQ